MCKCCLYVESARIFFSNSSLCIRCCLCCCCCCFCFNYYDFRTVLIPSATCPYEELALSLVVASALARHIQRERERERGFIAETRKYQKRQWLAGWLVGYQAGSRGLALCLLEILEKERSESDRWKEGGGGGGVRQRHASLLACYRRVVVESGWLLPFV